MSRDGSFCRGVSERGGAGNGSGAAVTSPSTTEGRPSSGRKVATAYLLVAVCHPVDRLSVRPTACNFDGLQV